MGCNKSVPQVQQENPALAFAKNGQPGSYGTSANAGQLVVPLAKVSRLEIWHDAENTILPPNVTVDLLYSLLVQRVYNVATGRVPSLVAPEAKKGKKKKRKMAPKLKEANVLVHWSIVIPSANTSKRLKEGVLQRMRAKPGVIHIDPGNKKGGADVTIKRLINTWIREQRLALKGGNKKTREAMAQTVAVLLSGDADFLDELQALRRLGVMVIVINNQATGSRVMNVHATVLSEWQQLLKKASQPTASASMDIPKSRGAAGVPASSELQTVGSAEADRATIELSGGTTSGSNSSNNSQQRSAVRQAAAVTTQDTALALTRLRDMIRDSRYQGLLGAAVKREYYHNFGENFPLKVKDAVNRLRRQGYHVVDTPQGCDLLYRLATEGEGEKKQSGMRSTTMNGQGMHPGERKSRDTSGASRAQPSGPELQEKALGQLRELIAASPNGMLGCAVPRNFQIEFGYKLPMKVGKAMKRLQNSGVPITAVKSGGDSRYSLQMPKHSQVHAAPPSPPPSTSKPRSKLKVTAAPFIPSYAGQPRC